MKQTFKVNNVEFLDDTNIEFAGKTGKLDKEQLFDGEWFYRLDIEGCSFLPWFKVEACQFVPPKKLSEMDEQERKDVLALWRVHAAKIAPDVAWKRILKGLGQAIFE